WDRPAVHDVEQDIVGGRLVELCGFREGEAGKAPRLGPYGQRWVMREHSDDRVSAAEQVIYAATGQRSGANDEARQGSHRLPAPRRQCLDLGENTAQRVDEPVGERFDGRTLMNGPAVLHVE